jgi:ABC-type antimicrobial peptide transport system permease subunit
MAPLLGLWSRLQLATLSQDLRFAARQLRANPGFTTTAALVLALGVIGLYGVVAYSVSRRRREIGIRRALGAQRGAVYGMILREAGTVAAIGIGAGLACSFAASKLIRDFLFGVEPWDAATLSLVAAALAASALLASYVPARRAASVDPAEVLRAE